MISQGKYTVWFKTPIGEGSGVVELEPDGRLSGRDSTFSYNGNWTQEGERIRAAMSATRVVPGPPGVFGLDEIDIVVAGQSDGGAGFSGTGFAKQAPGLKLELFSYLCAAKSSETSNLVSQLIEFAAGVSALRPAARHTARLRFG